ncbi:MAG: sigma 54-interacting transcriptional regulator [Clostridiales Family XIII bacterium]|jgi:transcriptional regulator with PAS, ATPase and Fis domain|nr:sigma 54-interacting transcriptional regulator [Clostridiales Family XIII bacterium]
MGVFNDLHSAARLTVEQMMNRNFKPLRVGDSLRAVVEGYHTYKINTLPVVDENENLVGVFPKKRLFKALLEGADLDASCEAYMVDNPVFVTTDRTYDEYSLVVRVTKSKVDNVVVLDQAHRVVGMIGAAEYLRESLNMINASSALLESLFRANAEGVVIVDKRDCILRVNPAAERMFGLRAADTVGRRLQAVLPEVAAADLSPFASAPNGGKDSPPPAGLASAVPAASRIGMKRTVKSLPVIINRIPIVENGEQIGASLAFLDVSDMEKIARELEIVKEMQTTIDGVLGASSDGVFVSDTSGLIKYVNERACRLLSRDPEQIIGKPLRGLLRTDSPAGATRSGAVEVDSCDIRGKKCIVSHVPFKKSGREDAEITGVVSTVYLNDNAITEEIAREWLYLNQQVQYYRDELEKRGGAGNRFDRIVTVNPAFKRLKSEALLIARSSSTVLLTGESGVGKDMFARCIHEASPRAKKPFIKVSCVSIPETLFESELFGYAPGSFTGALKNGKPGYFERANMGTIFLDEIGDMPLSVQAKLLQVLQEKEFVRVGGTSKLTVDVRVIAATNRNLREAIASKAFREDLFYRLNVIEFHLPPLRERPEDTIALAESFVEKYNRILGARVTGISERAKEVLRAHPWPGNIRELENAVERAANYVWEGEIGPENLPAQITEPAQKAEAGAPAAEYHRSLLDFEKAKFLDVLEKANGNKSAAARMLRMSRSAFYDRLAKYGLR